MNRILFTGLFIAACLRMSYSQETLTLENAIRIGLSNNYGINIARNAREIATNNASAGNAGMLPRIDVNAGYNHGISNAHMTNITGTVLDQKAAASDLVTAGVNLNWTVFDGLKMFVNYDKLKKLEEAGDLNAKIQVENTLAGIMNAYYDVIRQEKITNIMQEQVDISGFRLELAQLRFETGSGSELEFLKAKVELNADIARLSSQKTVFMNSHASLNELMARDVTTKFAVRDTILLNYTLVYDSLRASMRKSNRNLLLYNRNMEVSALSMKAARASQWPVLGLNAGINYLHLETEANIVNYNNNLGAVIGVTASMNLFNGLNLQREYRNAKLSLASSELEVKQLENHLETFLLKIYNDYSNRLELVGFETENVTLATKNMEIARTSFETGSISSLQLREIQKNLLEANTRLVEAEFGAKVTETLLLLLGGKLIN
jgi:outer membrane protein TolC